MAVNDGGQAIAAWLKTDPSGTTGVIVTSFFNHGTWSPPAAVAKSTPYDFENAFFVSAGMDAAGHALVLYTDSINGFDYSVKSIFFNGTEWEAPVTLDGNSLFPTVAVNANGQAAAIWTKGATVRAAHFDGRTWEPAVYLSSIPENYGTNIAINNANQAIAVFNHNNIIQSSFFNGRAWEPTQLVVKYPSGYETITDDTNISRVGMDDNGHAVAVWEVAHSNPITVQISSGLFNGSSWQIVPLPAAQATLPSVAVNRSGQAVAAWPLYDGNIIQASFLNGTTWQAPTTLIGTSLLLSNHVCVGITDAGQAIVAWSVSKNGPLNFTHCVQQAAIFDGTSWQPPVALSAPGKYISELDTPSLAISGSGRAVTSWVQTEGSFSNPLFFIQASVYNFELQGPQDFRGRVVKNSFLTQTDLIHLLTWKQSPDALVVGYKLYQNGVLIKEIPANKPLEVKLHNRHENKTYTYTLVAVSDTGTQSAPQTVILK